MVTRLSNPLDIDEELLKIERTSDFINTRVQRERKNRKVGSVDMSELSISVQPIRRHNCEE